jgi:rhodanese-related sulfurtransferase
VPTPIDRDQVRRLLEEGAQLVEVLPAEAYDKEHIAGAVSIPLETLASAAPQQLRGIAPSSSTASTRSET